MLLKILASLGPFMPLMHTLLTEVEDQTLQPKIKALIETVTDSDLKSFLVAVDQSLDALVKAEIGKL